MMKLVPCPCGEDAVWYKIATSPEKAGESAVCLLMDDAFADNYCAECFPLAVPEAERAGWNRIDDAGDWPIDAPSPAW